MSQTKKIHQGDLTVRKGVDYSEIEKVTGYLDCSGADTKAAFRGDLKVNDTACNARSFCARAFLFCDGILSKTISQKKAGSVVVYAVVVCGKTECSYVIDRNGIFSHGATIKEAKASLIFKTGERDSSEYKQWTLTTTITAAEAIASYRTITGACEFGTRNFCEDKDLTRKYTVHEVIRITKGAYGNDAYRNFFGASK